MLIVKAAAAAKSLQSCLTLRYPIDGSPPGSAIPGILQARILEWVAIAFSILKSIIKVCVKHCVAFKYVISYVFHNVDCRIKGSYIIAVLQLRE